MAFRLLHRFRPLGIRHSSSLHLLPPPTTSLLRKILDFPVHSCYRSYSDASRPLKEDSSPQTSMTGNFQVKSGNSNKSSLSQPELVKFSAMAESWWDPEGAFKPLHALNPVRLAFIRATLCDHFGRDPNSVTPFEGLKFVDVGCGGGILSEPLAQMGASVTAIDAVEKNIKIASLHAEMNPTTATIEYQFTTAEKLVEEQRQFDAVFSLEVVEHVADPAEFCKSLAALTVPNGALVMSTPHRCVRGYAATVVAAEYFLRWVPKGTHEWSKLLTPEELVLILNRASVSVQEMAGFAYDPLTGRWSISDDISVNYIAFCTKEVK